MNNQTATNPVNGYPAGPTFPPPPQKGFSFALNGVYFHNMSDADLRVTLRTQIGYYDPKPFDVYGVNKATEINMFIMGDYEDEPSAFTIGGVTCGLGYNPATPGSYYTKMFSTHRMYEYRQIHNGENVVLGSGGTTLVSQNSHLPIANSLCHEIGHMTGLVHTFDGTNNCADAAVSNRGQGWNNLMDQTGATGTALTPCQLGVVNANLYNPSDPTNSFHNYLSTSYCGEVPPRAFFVMATCLTPGSVVLDSRGTFMANRMTVQVYAYDATALTGRGALLASYGSNVATGGRWNLARLYPFIAGQRYYVALTASRASGQTHACGQFIDVVGPYDSPCAASQRPGRP